MLNDRILVRHGDAEGERRSTGGILIPATAQVGKRLTWAEIVSAGPNVRNMEIGDRVLFNPEDRYEVEVGGTDYIILRERDVWQSLRVVWVRTMGSFSSRSRMVNGGVVGPSSDGTL